MRHNRAGFKLKRNVAARNSLLRGLVTSVIENDFAITTVPKAKAVRPLVDRMITLGYSTNCARMSSMKTRLFTLTWKRLTYSNTKGSWLTGRISAIVSRRWQTAAAAL